MHWDAVRSPFDKQWRGHLLSLRSLAMAEMTTLLAALYREYTTEPKGDFGDVSPAITSRFEVFYDEGSTGVRVCFHPSLFIPYGIYD